jgi:hypothetical protein
MPLEVDEEPIPVFTGWSDSPGGHLRLGSNPACESPSRQAIEKGFAFARLSGKHFHRLVDLSMVVQALLDLTNR